MGRNGLDDLIQSDLLGEESFKLELVDDELRRRVLGHHVMYFNRQSTRVRVEFRIHEQEDWFPVEE